MKISRSTLIALTAVLCVVLIGLTAAAVTLSGGENGGSDTTGSIDPGVTTQQTIPGGEQDTIGAPEMTGDITEASDPLDDTTVPAPMPQPTQGSSGGQQSQVKGISYPYSLESGKLEIQSLFQFTGFNPDCGGKEGSNIAAVQVKNTSAAHLTQADITMTMADGGMICFHIRDLCPGMSAMVFSDANISIGSEDVCIAVSCTVSFENESPLMADCIQLSVEGTSVTVTNVSGETLTNVTVYCHCTLDELCFGGLTYSYTIDSLPAGGSATVEAWDCYLGKAEVVRVGTAS